jgi:hypothetical protein
VARPLVLFGLLALASLVVILTWRWLILAGVTIAAVRVLTSSRAAARPRSTLAQWAQVAAIGYVGRRVAKRPAPVDLDARLLEHMARFHPELLGSAASGGPHGAEDPPPSREKER